MTATEPTMRPIAATMNHLLKQDPACRKLLQAHHGKVASVDTGVMQLQLRIDEEGYLATAPADAVASVTIRVKAADVPLMMADMDRAMSYVQISGDADLANTLSQVSRRLRWDAEDDLSHLVGDIAAVRLVAAGKAALDTARTSSRKLAENVAEYLVEEQPVLVRPEMIRGFTSDVAVIRDDVERLVKRLEKLERH